MDTDASQHALADALAAARAHPVLALLSLAALYAVAKVVYNMYLHPLAKIPGPRLAAATDLWFGWVGVTGHQYLIVKDLHARYGPIVRLGPSELSFASASALHTIYNRPKAGKKLFRKSKFWKAIAMGFQSAGIATEQDVAEHKRKRAYLQPLLSLSATRKYLPTINENVAKYLQQLEIRGARAEGVDVVDLLHYVTFDITGDLLFGESFGAVEAGKPHEWFALILDNVDIASYTQLLQRIPALNAFVLALLPKKLRDARTYHVRETTTRVMKRINAPHDPDRKPDILTHLLELSAKDPRITVDEIASQATNLIIGGSETVSTAIIFTLYHLLCTPHILAAIHAELRSSQFPTLDSVTGAATAHLPMFNAAIKEGFRMNTPAPTGFPRVSPGETVDGIYIPEGTGVFVHPWTVLRTPLHWRDADTFRPERWLEADSDDVREAYAPFGLGSRQCLAAELAWDELRKILGSTLWLFDITMVDDADRTSWMDRNMAYLLWKKAPLRLRAVRRPGV
ncbi:cytochrome P450 [Geopyxis carbonaria]|nr:cytochrome P450 [Geopyxis carbonaria]